MKKGWAMPARQGNVQGIKSPLEGKPPQKGKVKESERYRGIKE